MIRLTMIAKIKHLLCLQFTSTITHMSSQSVACNIRWATVRWATVRWVDVRWATVRWVNVRWVNVLRPWKAGLWRWRVYDPEDVQRWDGLTNWRVTRASMASTQRWPLTENAGLPWWKTSTTPRWSETETVSNTELTERQELTSAWFKINPKTVCLLRSTHVKKRNNWEIGEIIKLLLSSQGLARTQSPTTKNYAPELPTFGAIARVSMYSLCASKHSE